jgi:hypothetical protein
MMTDHDVDLAKREAAIEIMAAMLGTRESRKREKKTNLEIIAQIEAEEEMLRREKDEIYSGNSKTIEKALTVYAKEIRAQRER